MKTHDSLIFERVVQASNQQPEWPEEFEAKFEHKVGHHDQNPDEQKFHVQKGVAVWKKRGSKLV